MIVNSRSVPMMVRMVKVTVWGKSRGKVTLRKRCHAVAPSTWAASGISCGMVCNPARYTIIGKPTPAHSAEPVVQHPVITLVDPAPDLSDDNHGDRAGQEIDGAEESPAAQALIDQ